MKDERGEKNSMFQRLLIQQRSVWKTLLAGLKVFILHSWQYYTFCALHGCNLSIYLEQKYAKTEGGLGTRNDGTPMGNLDKHSTEGSTKGGTLAELNRKETQNTSLQHRKNMKALQDSVYITLLCILQTITNPLENMFCPGKKGSEKP